MVFYAPRPCDTLTWKRKAQWSVYPEDHVGRPEGTARALPDPSLVAKAGSWMEVAYREKPTWPWFMDANALGTRDFRATRRNIVRASLKDSSGNGITVLSDGTQHTRSFLDDNQVGLLVACYSGPALNTSWLHGLWRSPASSLCPCRQAQNSKMWCAFRSRACSAACIAVSEL